MGDTVFHAFDPRGGNPICGAEGFVSVNPTCSECRMLTEGIVTYRSHLPPAPTREVRTTSSTGGQKGVKEARFDLIPAGPHKELAILFGRGARKYADNQWRKGYEWTKSMGAIERHYNEFKAGRDYDVCSNEPAGCQHVDSEGNPFDPPAPDTCYNHTGAHHMTAVAWHSFVLLEFKETHPQHDDRYIPDPFEDFNFNKIAPLRSE